MSKLQASGQASSAHCNRIFIVIPAFNEERAIGDLVAELRRRYDHVVVVNDCSTDKTGQIAELAGAEVLRHLVNRGQGAALQTGITYSLSKSAEYIVTFDGDGQHDPEDIPNLLKPILRGEADVVLGSRFLGCTEGMSFARRLLLKAAVIFTRLTTRIAVTDTHNGLRAFSRRAATGLNLTMDHMAHASQILDQIRDMGFPYLERPVTIRYTAYSRAKGQRFFNAFGIVVDYFFRKLTK
jgi:glycosyltransferase involved in cell wall biosynthesis